MPNFDLGVDEYLEDDRLHSNYVPPIQKSNDRLHRRARNYGLTKREYLAMHVAQQGLCAICQCASDLVIDHCHATGRVRGLLCSKCNTGLGLFQEDIQNIYRAFYYLKTGIVKS